jgi:hypothetical protein
MVTRGPYLNLNHPNQKAFGVIFTKVYHHAFGPNSGFNDGTMIKLKVKVKLSLCRFLTEYDAMKAYWGMEV